MEHRQFYFVANYTEEKSVFVAIKTLNINFAFFVGKKFWTVPFFLLIRLMWNLAASATMVINNQRRKKVFTR